MRQRHLLLPVLVFSSACAAWAQSLVPLNTVPSRVAGHCSVSATCTTNEGNTISTQNPDLVEGRELWAPYGIAEDTSASPPILYVSDTNNSRVLAWANATAFTNGKPADMVIGQKDFYSTFPQGPGQTFPGGLSYPGALTVDAALPKAMSIPIFSTTF